MSMAQRTAAAGFTLDSCEDSWVANDSCGQEFQHHGLVRLLIEGAPCHPKASMAQGTFEPKALASDPLARLKTNFAVSWVARSSWRIRSDRFVRGRHE